MSVAQETPVASSVANGVTVSFPYAFTVLQAADLKVKGVLAGVETLYTYGVHYTISGLGTNAGSADFLAAPANGTVITRYRDSQLVQPTDYQDNGDLLAATVNLVADRPWLALQEQALRTGGAVRVPYPEQVAELPTAATRKGTVLAFDTVTGAPILGPTIAAVGTVADASAAIATVAGSIANVNTVAGAIGNVNNVGGSIANVNTVTGSIANVNTVAGSIAGVNTTAANLAAILDAPVQAAAAAASRAAVDARIYPGTYAADPLTRPDGSARQAGDVYFTTAGVSKVFAAGVWAQVPGASAADLANSIDPAKGAALVGFAGESVNTALQALVARDVAQFNAGRRLTRTVYGRDTLQLSDSRLHVPSLTLADLASAAGLAVHASGGIIAAAAGVTGTGKITLPAGIDPAKPFRVHMLVEVNESVNNLFVQLGSTGAPPFWSGARFNVIKTTGLTGNDGNTVTFNGLGAATGIPVGTQFWISICGDGQYVTTSVTPNIASGALDATWLQRCNAIFQPKYNSINWADQITSDVSSGAGQYTWGRVGQADQLTQIYFQTSSITTRLIGVYCNIGEMVGPGDRRLGAPVVMALNNSQDCTGVGASEPFILLPPNWGCPGQRDFVMQHHPNGNSGTLLQSNSGPSALALYAAGYGQGTITGCQVAADFAGATSSNWGAPTGLQYRKNFLDYFRNAFRFDGKLIHFGMSMGLLNALAYVREYGEGDAIVGISGVCDLTDSFNNRGFAAIINAGYGAWYVSTVDGNLGNVPEASPTQWARINRGAGATGLKSLVSPFNWRNLYAGGTTYAKQDVVYRPYTAGIAALAAYDPTLTPKLYAGLPIKLWHGDADPTIPIAQANAFVAAVNKYGAAASVVTVVGGVHLGASVYDPTNIVAFLDSLA